MQAPPAESVSENRRQRTRKWLKAWLADIQEFYAVKEDFLNLGDAVNDGKYDTLETFLEDWRSVRSELNVLAKTSGAELGAWVTDLDIIVDQDAAETPTVRELILDMLKAIVTKREVSVGKGGSHLWLL